MGLFDLPSPLLDLLDGLLAFLPPLFRIVLWGLVSGVLSMLLYAMLSPQGRLTSIKQELQEARALLAGADESFDELLGLVQKTLRLSFKHLGLVLLPALVASLPLISVLAWASNEFGYQFPKTGAQVALTALPADSARDLQLQPEAQQLTTNADGQQEFTWPAPGSSLTLADGQGRALLQLPPPVPVPQIHKRLWWNNLLGNPIGYLPDDTGIEVVFIDIPGRSYLPFGPGWLGHWLTLFFSALVVSALATKFIFRIE